MSGVTAEKVRRRVRNEEEEEEEGRNEEEESEGTDIGKFVESILEIHVLLLNTG